MSRRRGLVSGVLLLLAVASLAPAERPALQEHLTLPDKLSDQQFWSLSASLSESDGMFRSDNLLSNEIQLQHVIPGLVRTVKPGTVYLGVGPEQNYTYISAVRPAMAFIVDIRRGNLQLHLLYKALFALSADRADFVGRLFSKKRPPGLSASSTADDIFKAYWNIDTSDALYKENLAAVRALLARRHGIKLSTADADGIEAVYYAFFWFGPTIQYSSNQGRGGGAYPTYAQLATATDADGVARGFLSTEERYAFVKDLHARNLIVPVVGDFAGASALRSVGRYLKDRDAIVGAFYLSNVEQYLSRERRWEAFCANAAALPRDSNSTFIRSVRSADTWYGIGLSSVLGNMAAETKSCGLGLG